MSAALLLAALLAQSAPVVTVEGVEGALDRVDVAYAELSRGQNRAAIDRIRANPALSDDPAALINLGTATARLGDRAGARDYYMAALTSRDRYDLELADGRWMDSRQAARAAIAGLATDRMLAVR